MLDNPYLPVLRHINHYYHYVPYIANNGLAFYCNNNNVNNKVKCQVRRSPSAYLSALLIFLFAMRGLWYLVYHDYYDTPEKQIHIFTALFPTNGGFAMEITLVCWSFMHVAYVFYVLNTRLNEFRFLAVLLVDQTGSYGVSRKDLG